MRWNRLMPPDEFCIAQGAKFVCLIDCDNRHRSGKIVDEQGATRWQYDTRPNPEGRSWRNPLNKPDFVFTDPAGHAEIVIRRVSCVPSVFQILERAQSIGQIAVRSLLGMKYDILLDGQPPATFRLPAFTVCYGGGPDSGQEIWVVVGPGKMQWNVLLKPGVKEDVLVVSLAFIHNHKWNYG